jgi:hypothetical protein
MARVILNAGQALHDLRDTRQRPKIGLETVSPRPLA